MHAEGVGERGGRSSYRPGTPAVIGPWRRAGESSVVLGEKDGQSLRLRGV